MGWLVVESIISGMSATCGSGASCAKVIVEATVKRVRTRLAKRMDTPNFGGTILVLMECKISKNNAGSVTKMQKMAILPLILD